MTEEEETPPATSADGSRDEDEEEDPLVLEVLAFLAVGRFEPTMEDSCIGDLAVAVLLT